MSVNELLCDNNNWAKGTIARDKNGKAVLFGDPKACKYCLMGAMWKVYGRGCELQEHRNNDKFVKLDLAIRMKYHQSLSIPVFNDTATHGEVVEITRIAGV